MIGAMAIKMNAGGCEWQSCVEKARKIFFQDMYEMTPLQDKDLQQQKKVCTKYGN